MTIQYYLDGVIQYMYLCCDHAVQSIVHPRNAEYKIESIVQKMPEYGLVKACMVLPQHSVYSLSLY